jgi:hypothetical protein
MYMMLSTLQQSKGIGDENINELLKTIQEEDKN